MAGTERNNLDWSVKKEVARLFDKIRRSEDINGDEFGFILEQAHEKNFPTEFPTNEQLDFLLTQYYQKGMEALKRTGYKKGLETYGMIFALECKVYDFKQKMRAEDFDLDILSMYLKAKRQTLENVIRQVYEKKLGEMKKFGKDSALTKLIKENVVEMMAHHQDVYKRLSQKKAKSPEMIMQLDLAINNYHESTNQCFNI